MKPPKTEIDSQGDLFRTRLETLCDPSHELVKLAHAIDWDALESRFEPVYAEVGRPAARTRLMVGLIYLQSLYGLSEDEVVDRWAENPFWQYFCGETFFACKKPLARSGMSKWRKRVKKAGMEELLAETISVGLKVGAVKPSSLERIMVDTTAQPKAVAFPTDSRLLNRSRERLVRLAGRFGVPLRQSYRRKGPEAVRKAGRYAHARQMNRSKREIKRLRTFLGRVVRDLGRKLGNFPDAAPLFEEELRLAKRLLAQKRSDKNKLYSLHEPHVACIAKGKAHPKYEFGAKAGIATTNREEFTVGALSWAGNPYDGHTLEPQLEKVVRLTGVRPERCYVDRGYRGHGVTATRVIITGQRRGVTPTIKREMKRRNAIERVIGHQKNKHRLDRNFLRGELGDDLNVLMAGIGFNLRLILKKLRLLWLRFWWMVLVTWGRSTQSAMA